jgi:hypothetical protein
MRIFYGSGLDKPTRAEQHKLGLFGYPVGAAGPNELHILSAARQESIMGFVLWMLLGLAIFGFFTWMASV